MRNEKFIENIQNPMHVGEKEITDMRISLELFPYFQSMQLLYTKGLHNIDSISYNKQLRKAAAYASDRKFLFKLITENVIAYEKPNGIEIRIEPKEETQIEKIKVEKELEIGKPLQFTKKETHSFSEWLALTKTKKIDRTKNKNSGNLIEKFIKEEPTISKPKKEEFFSPIKSARESLIENKEIVTETLARVYLEQGYLDKAITAYKKLSLKFPQKSSFFATQIKLIYDLKNK
jgi:hypothetical protein